ncbi:MAG: 4-hydroxy-tetrahydrodipicolinate reductase [Aminipila sp.]
MNIAIVGTGAMGTVLKGLIEEKENMECVAFIEPMKGESLEDVENDIDVIIDFSNPANLNKIDEFVRKKGCGVVFATTGFDELQDVQIRELSRKVPVVKTANFSLGITVMKKVIDIITPVLRDSFDMEIIEKHHNMKLDSPSGTAKLLADAMNPKKEYALIHGRTGNRKRAKEIGIHAIRGGTIAGEHTVLFAGEDEILEIKHTALSKKIFAAGALKAAEFVYERIITGIQNEAVGVGLYDMDDVLFH